MNIFEIVGTVFSITGAFLFSTKHVVKQKVRLIAFLIYLVSNTCFIILFFINKLYGASFTNFIFLLTSINGIRNNINFKGDKYGK